MKLLPENQVEIAAIKMSEYAFDCKKKKCCKKFKKNGINCKKCPKI